MEVRTGTSAPPRTEEPPPFSLAAVVGFMLVSLAVLMLLPAGALMRLGVQRSEWPQWVYGLLGLSLPIGLVSLIVLLVAQWHVWRARGDLRGGAWVKFGLGLAGLGTLANYFIFRFVTSLLLTK
jgi:predicted lysophospholipase L1 biosynthesis ABC-type transport system permease subunit